MVSLHVLIKQNTMGYNFTACSWGEIKLDDFLRKYIGARFGEIFPGENFPIYGTMLESGFARLVQGWFGLECVVSAEV